MLDKIKENWLLVMIAFAILLALLFTIVGQNNMDTTLNPYTGSDITKEELIKETESKEDTFVYTEETLNFSVNIPYDWTKVIKSGFVTFIHQPTGSAVQLQVLDYDPGINNVSSESISSQIVSDGKTFVSYERINASCYQACYYDKGYAVYDYIEDVRWDKEHIIKLVCTLDEQYYSQMIPYFDEIIGSFAWECSDPLPDGYYLYYNAYADFEMALPDDWATGLSENTVFAQDTQYGGTLSLTYIPSSDYLDDFKSTDMSALISGSKGSFMMSTFESSHTKAKAASTFVSDNIQYSEFDYLFANGAYNYLLTVTYETGLYDNSLSEILEKNFREFISSKREAGLIPENETMDNGEFSESEAYESEILSETDGIMPETSD